MGKHSKKPKQSTDSAPEQTSPEPPRLANRRENKQSSFRMGRTIGEQREHLETANERAAARKKDKQKQARRVFVATFGFVGLIFTLAVLAFIFVGNGEPAPIKPSVEIAIVEPTINIVDEDAANGEEITNRMRSYIGQVEKDLRDLGLQPTKAIIPTGTIREVDIYLSGYSGFIKMNIDRGSAVSAEDTERMLRYLSGIGVGDFQYIDVRISGKAYWK